MLTWEASVQSAINNASIILIIGTLFLLVDLSIQDFRKRVIDPHGFEIYAVILGFSWIAAIREIVPFTVVIIIGFAVIALLAKRMGLIGGADVLTLIGVSILMIPVFSTLQVISFWMFSMLAGACLIVYYHVKLRTAPFMVGILTGYILVFL